MCFELKKIDEIVKKKFIFNGRCSRGATTFTTMTLSLIALSIPTLSIVALRMLATQHNNLRHSASQQPVLCEGVYKLK